MNKLINIEGSNWRAKLELSLSGREDKTVLSHRKSFGPLVVQKPFYPEGDVCHIYILHPPGGIVGGDVIELNIKAENEAHGLITTPGATKFYRSEGRLATVRQTITVEAGSTLEWLPQETIFFDQSYINTQTKINIEQGGAFSGWEISCFGRPASDESFLQGKICQSFEIWRDGRPLFLDRAKLTGGDDVFKAQWGLQEYRTSGIFILTSATNEMLLKAREALGDEVNESGIIGLSLVGDVLVCRALADQAEWVKKRFITIWQVLRPSLLSKEASLPRIWAT